MKSLSIAWEPCVRTRTRASTCQACVDACPTAALDLSGPRGSVAADLARCTECGLCQAACPTEALSSAFDPAVLLASGRTDVRCGEGAPCTGALSAEDLVTLALRGGEVTLTAVASCAAAAGHAVIASRVAEANVLLDALGAPQRISVRAETKEPASPPPEEAPPPRRAFFAGLLSGRTALDPAAAPRHEKLTLDLARLDIAAMRAPTVPARRRRLLDAIGAVGPGGADRPPIPAASIGFTSSKALDPGTCTACVLCVMVCPTGALSTSAWGRELGFDASRCVKCAACHEACEPRSLTLAPALDVEAFASGRSRPLGRFAVRSCGECGALFKRRGDEGLCPRCLSLDEEARDLVRMK